MLENVFSAATAPVAARAPVADSRSAFRPRSSPPRATACISFAPTSSSSSTRSSSRSVMLPAKILVTRRNSRLPSGCARWTEPSTTSCRARASSAHRTTTSRCCSTRSSATTWTATRSTPTARRPAASSATPNYATTTNVVDADPRIISNLIADQTASNPPRRSPPKRRIRSAAHRSVRASTASSARPTIRPVFEIPNVEPDAGVSAPFNSWMTFFGQFFDHGLDLVDKGGNGTSTFRCSRTIRSSPGTTASSEPATISPRANASWCSPAPPTGGAGRRGWRPRHGRRRPLSQQRDDAVHRPEPDLHLASLRTRCSCGSTCVDRTIRRSQTGRLLEGSDGGLAHLGTISRRRRATCSASSSTDTDILDVPLLATDAYGNFIPGANGYAQVVTEPRSASKAWRAVST